MNNTIIVVGIALVVVLVCVIIFYGRRRRSVFGEMTVNVVDVLALHDVVRFFRKDEVLAKLKASQNVIAVAVKEKGHSGRLKIMLCTFDNATSKVSEPLAIYDVGRMDESLTDAFGEKDMLVLK